MKKAEVKLMLAAGIPDIRPWAHAAGRRAKLFSCSSFLWEQ